MGQNKIPRWLQGSLDYEDLSAIEQAVARAEGVTAGEIIPMIVHRSSAVGHVVWLVWLLLILFILSAESLVAVFDWAWGASWSWLVLLLVGMSYPIARRLAALDLFQRILTSNRDEVDQVYRRAELEFYRHRVNSTESGTGILLFVSWMERRAVVLADQGIARHYPQETWAELVEILLEHARDERWREGFVRAIDRCGEILGRHLPATQASRKNELHNHLVIVE